MRHLRDMYSFSRWKECLFYKHDVSYAVAKREKRKKKESNIKKEEREEERKKKRE